MKTNSIYSRELRLLRPMAQWVSSHPRVINLLSSAVCGYMAYYVFMYA